MQRRRVAIALAILATALHVPASMPLPIPLRELYGAAEAVALVEVVEGRLVSAGGDICGARYTGRVLEDIKGTKSGLVIEFGFLPSLKVGGSYLLFLGGYENVYIPGAPDFLARCKSVLPPANTLAHWRGALEVVGNTAAPDQRATWTVRPVKHVIFPLGVRTKLVDGEKQMWFSDLLRRMIEK